MVIDFRNATIQKYAYSVVGNRNYDKILFFAHLVDVENFDVYLKLENDEYVDKIKIPDTDVEIDTDNEVVMIKWTMTQIATMCKKLKMQISFENPTDEQHIIIAQTRIVELSLGNTIDFGGDIPIIYPTIIEQILHDIKELEEQVIIDLTMSYSNDTLIIGLKNYEGTIFEEIQVSVPTQLCYVGASYNSTTHILTLTRNNNQTTEIDFSDIYTELDKKVDKVQGMGLSHNDYSDDEKQKVASNTNARHTHSNKELLDTYTQTENDLADAVAKKHSHSNKAILDETTASYTTEEKSKLSGIESGAQANVIEGIKVNNEPLTPTEKVVNIDLTPYALNSVMKTYAKSLVVSMDSSTYVISFTLKDSEGNTLSSQSVDLPMESVVVGGSYDNNTKSLILTLQNGNTITIPVADLVSGLVSETSLAQTLLNYYTKTQVDTELAKKQDALGLSIDNEGYIVQTIDD